MSKALRLLVAAVAVVVAQTTLVGYIRIAGVAPDLMCSLLAAVTTYCGVYGGYCVGAVMSLLYDASVGYQMVLKAVNVVSYTIIGMVSPYLRGALGGLLRKFRHKSYLEMMLVCFLMTAAREIVDIGYLFIIGSEQSLTTLLRMLLCCAYSAAMTLPVAYLLGRLMAWRPRFLRATAPQREAMEAETGERDAMAATLAEHNRRHRKL